MIIEENNIEAKFEALLNILRRLLEIQSDLLKSGSKTNLPRSSA